jgi:hypothetical protein
MLRFRCPECGIETEMAPQDGDEIVSVYCLKHTGGVDAHRRPVYMRPVPAVATGTEPEPALEFHPESAGTEARASNTR